MSKTKLNQVFTQLDVKQAQLVRALQKKGFTFSTASLSRLKRFGEWPKKCNKEAVQNEIEAYLLDLGASPKQLTDLWGVCDSHKKPLKEEIEHEDPEPEMLTTQAKRHFKLRQDPFENEITTEDDVFMVDSHRLVLEEMLSAASAGSMVALIGECGSGKTIIRRAFVHRVQQQNPEVVLIQPARLDRRKLTAESISSAICRALQVKSGGKSAEERDAAIEEALISSANNGHLHLMIIDEAHDLTPDVIKLLKRIWELTHGFKRVMGIVLIGQTELTKKLSGQNVREFTWRCNQIKMQPLGLHVPAYIEHKFGRIGIDANELFTQDAMGAIRGKCYGKIKQGMAFDDVDLDRSFPLQVNTWITKVLNMAANIGETKITEQMVHKV
ncbi:AAA family ATPase [Pseudoalteromonas sp. MM17-2]|uniref:ExeA family protein n=1 Tax=Pseudoalteromonas TaxID=53246 RepID=UPI001EF5DCD6|nr:AAA family ATPase [Pseudoalteromonas ruthenica]MCG7545574.1 AAA family ATPase [Pseudoalteromonas sp. MM17-2]